MPALDSLTPVESAISPQLLDYINTLPDKSQQPQRTFTMQQASRYDGEDGRLLYVVVDGRVLDVTDFARVHPGGPGPLKMAVGSDAGAAVRARMPRAALALMTRFQVGTIQN